MVLVKDHTSNTLLQVICDYIEEGSTVISDSWRACDGFNTGGYRHLTGNHSMNLVNPHIDAHNNNDKKIHDNV